MRLCGNQPLNETYFASCFDPPQAVFLALTLDAIGFVINLALDLCLRQSVDDRVDASRDVEALDQSLILEGH